jgi:hypothetical protein
LRWRERLPPAGAKLAGLEALRHEAWGGVLLTVM